MSIDLRGKNGMISKTVQVHSNDPKKPQTALTISLRIKDEFHSKKHKSDKIFDKPCSGCHIDSGKNKKGLALFTADCAMCHANNKSASPVQAFKNLPDERLRSAVEKGTDNSMMPGWSEQRGGPLTKEQIDSLVEFMKMQ